MENVWLYYFSSLAQTIGLGAALLLGIAVLKIQLIGSNLEKIESSIAQCFFNANEFDAYTLASNHLIAAGAWNQYFNSVNKLFVDFDDQFDSPESSFLKSAAFGRSLAERGLKLSKELEDLSRNVKNTFAIALSFCFLCVIALPLAKNASSILFNCYWATSAVLTILVFTFFIRVVFKTTKP